MDIILHLGAHRCASTSFQFYIRDHRTTLAAQSVGFWGPRRTRGGLFSGLFPGPTVARGRDLVRRAEGRVKMQLSQARQRGLKQLLISDENMGGTMRHSVRCKTLYPAMGDRMARHGAAFGGQITRIVLSIRALDLWWGSAAAYTVARGHAVPEMQCFDMMVQNRRSWRDVITDLACAVPDAEIIIAPFEQFAGQPQALLETMLDGPAPVDTTRHWRNRTPNLPEMRRQLQAQGRNPEILPDGEGRWTPFTHAQAASLREVYADDLHWLVAGADGLARLANDPTRIQTGKSLRAGDLTEGRPNDSRQERLARSG